MLTRTCVQVECTAREDIGLLGTCTVDVHFVFPATTVMLNSSRLAVVDGEFVKAIGHELEIALAGRDRAPGSTFLPFGAQQVRVNSLPLLPRF